MSTLSADDRYVVETVAEDLRFLQDEWDETVDDHSLRRSSGVLRILLVDDAFGRAWRLMGFPKQPNVKANNLHAIVATAPRKDLTYAQAAGARHGGMEIVAPVLIGSGTLTDEDAQKLDVFLSQDFTREFALRDFVESTCIMGGGQNVKRREVVQFVANKLGGTHLDTVRNRKRDAAYALLDELMATMVLGGKPAVFYELLAIGQAVAASEDATALRDAVAELKVTP
jgi:hypothetical protein